MKDSIPKYLVWLMICECGLKSTIFAVSGTIKAQITHQEVFLEWTFGIHLKAQAYALNSKPIWLS